MAVFLRCTMYAHTSVTGQRASIAETRERLDARLMQMVQVANWHERLRRSANGELP
jgi:hypothetical protein